MSSLVLDGRTAIVTGANQGLGKAIAEALVKAGANVVLCARDAELLARVGKELEPLARNGARVTHMAADVEEEDAIRNVVQFAVSNFKRFEILVNNAGIYGPIGLIEDIDWKQWVKAVSVNVLGSVRFAREVIPHFKAQKYGKIIQLSGGGATNPLPRLSAYAASKAAIVRFAETLAVETKEYRIDVNSIAPGSLNTRLLDEVLDAGPNNAGQAFYERAVRQRKQGGTPLQIPAALCVFLASAASDGITGKLISALWDNWESFPIHLSELSSSDVYTLRRVIGKERGMDWADK